MPADFVERAADGTPVLHLIRHYRTRRESILRWIEEAGLSRSAPRPGPFRPIPDDFMERVKLMRPHPLAKSYGVSVKMIRTWMRLRGLSEYKAPITLLARKIPVPADFAEIAPTMTQTGLVRHYGHARSVVLGWCQETGIQPRPADPEEYHHGRAFRRTPYKRGFGLALALHAAPRERSLAADAQLTIQKRMPCFRARTVDPRAPSDQWIVGGRRMSEAEMISMAERYQGRVAA